MYSYNLYVTDLLRGPNGQVIPPNLPNTGSIDQSNRLVILADIHSAFHFDNPPSKVNECVTLASYLGAPLPLDISVEECRKQIAQYLGIVL